MHATITAPAGVATPHADSTTGSLADVEKKKREGLVAGAEKAEQEALAAQAAAEAALVESEAAKAKTAAAQEAASVKRAEAMAARLKADNSQTYGLMGPAPSPNPDYPNLALGHFNDSMFARINLSYPGLQLVHEKPYIFIVNDFITTDECKVIIGKSEYWPLTL